MRFHNLNFKFLQLSSHQPEAYENDLQENTPPAPPQSSLSIIRNLNKQSPLFIPVKYIITHISIALQPTRLFVPFAFPSPKTLFNFYYRTARSPMKLEVNCDYNDNVKAKQALYKEVSLSPDTPLEIRQFEICEKPNLRIYCSSCELELSRTVAVLTRTDYYCVPCLANLDEYPNEYLIRRAFTFSPTNSAWDLKDELVLVTAFHIWGYSNWSQIKDYMDYNQCPFSLPEIEKHYQQHHYQTPDGLLNFPSDLPHALPHPSHGEIALEVYERAYERHGELKHRDSKGEKKINSMKSIPSVEVQSERAIKPPSIDSPSLDRHPQENIHPPPDIKTESAVLGYNLKRDEFETFYYDPEAERMLQQLQFYDNDTPQQYALKIQLIENYNRRLDERAKRKAFTLEYKLLDTHYQFAKKQEEKAAGTFQPFMRFTNGHQQYKRIVQDLSRLDRQKKCVNLLSKIRSKVTQKGELEVAYSFLSAKRKKSIEMWEKTYNKSYVDKKSRKIYKKDSISGGEVVIKEEEEEPENVNVNVKEKEAPLTFDLLQSHILEYLRSGSSNFCLKLTALKESALQPTE